jgi:putative membrane protein
VTASFSWTQWDFHVDMLAGVVIATIGYWLATGPLASRIVPDRPVPPTAARCRLSFLAAMLVLVFSLNGPLHDLSDYYLFSAHMVQHLLLTLLMPPLLLLGIPAWLADAALERPWVRTAARRLVHPVTAGVVATAVVAAWHFPGPYGLMMRNHDVHVVMHVSIMAVGVLMWWPVVSPSTVLPALPPGGKMLYLFLLGIPMSAVGAFITLAESPLYGWYVAAPRVFALSPKEDQTIGGLTMWVLGTMVLWGVMTVIWFRWGAREAD